MSESKSIELLRLRNAGYSICERCGEIMERKKASDGAGFICVCPLCGHTDVINYEREDKDDQESEWTSEMSNAYDGDVPPDGCRACGGPYPDCMTSCKLFDE